MAIGQFAFQQAIFTTLNVDAITDTLSCGVVDEVKQNQAYPFITIGEETAIDYSTKDIHGGEYTVNIDIWSQYKGSKESMRGGKSFSNSTTKCRQIYMGIAEAV